MIWARGLGLLLVGVIPLLTGLDPEETETISLECTDSRVLISLWVHIGLAALIVGISYKVTAAVHPYSYMFQNSLDKALVASTLCSSFSAECTRSLPASKTKRTD